MTIIQKETLSRSERYAISFQCDEPKYYSNIPRILDYLWVENIVDNKKIRSRLSVYAKELYRIMKGFGCSSKPIYPSIETLAKLVGCSVGSINNAKKELLQPLTQLDGKSLITEIKKKKSVLGKNGRKCKFDYCLYEITHIWNYNNAFFSSEMHKDGWLDQYCVESKDEADSCGESDVAPDSYDESGYNTEADSCGDDKQDIYINNQLYLKQSAADADECFQNSENLFSSDIRRNISQGIEKSYEWLLNAKFQESQCQKLSKIYSLNDLKSAANYMKKKNQDLRKWKKPTIDNPHGYLINCLKNRYWEIEEKNDKIKSKEKVFDKI